VWPRFPIGDATAEIAGIRRGSAIGTVSDFLIPREEAEMLWTIALVLLVLWALGLVSSYTLGGFIHLLLVAALVVILVRVIQGRRVDV